MFGPVTTHPKAGDFAPDIVFTQILSPGSAPWTSANLTGRLTVLAFFPDTSHNLQTVTRWNALVEQFRDKPVQFAWITSEYQPPIEPWLREHPVKGWVFLDPLGGTGVAYGLEMPAAVIVGSDRKILGFDPAMIPEAHTIDAALGGRTDRLRADSPRMPRPEDHRPDFLPSYTVHISPAKSKNGGDYSSDDYQSFQGYDLKDMLARLFDTNPIRIQLPASVDDGQRYDFTIVLPAPESRESMYHRILHGIEDHFQVAAVREDHLVDVYVVTATGGGKPPAAAPREEDGGVISSSSVQYQVQMWGHTEGLTGPPKAVPLGDIRGIAVEGTVDEFCRTLEQQLDRPVVNESGLPGEFAFHVRVPRNGPNDLPERLRDQLHLRIDAARRRVPLVVLQPR